MFRDGEHNLSQQCVSVFPHPDGNSFSCLYKQNSPCSSLSVDWYNHCALMREVLTLASLHLPFIPYRAVGSNKVSPQCCFLEAEQTQFSQLFSSSVLQQPCDNLGHLPLNMLWGCQCLSCTGGAPHRAQCPKCSLISAEQRERTSCLCLMAADLIMWPEIGLALDVTRALC